MRRSLSSRITPAGRLRTTCSRRLPSAALTARMCCTSTAFLSASAAWLAMLVKSSRSRGLNAPTASRESRYMTPRISCCLSGPPPSARPRYSIGTHMAERMPWATMLVERLKRSSNSALAVSTPACCCSTSWMRLDGSVSVCCSPLRVRETSATAPPVLPSSRSTAPRSAGKSSNAVESSRSSSLVRSCSTPIMRETSRAARSFS